MCHILVLGASNIFWEITKLASWIPDQSWTTTEFAPVTVGTLANTLDANTLWEPPGKKGEKYFLQGKQWLEDMILCHLPIC